MNPYAKRAAEIEAAFLTGAQTNLNQAKGTQWPGTKWTSAHSSQEPRVRDLVAASGQPRDVLQSVPKNRSYVLTGMQRRWLFAKRRTSVAIATILSPIEHYVNEQSEPGPVDLAQVESHVAGLIGEADVPHVVGVCSPSGFTTEAKQSGLKWPNVTLVLVEPRGDGGWNVTAASPDATEADCRLFDPEAVAQKLKRIRERIETRSGELVTGGLNASAIARQMNLPKSMVETAFDQAAADDRELRVARQDDDVLLFRGAPADREDYDMSMADRIRKLLGGEGNETNKINALSERRAKLVQRRDGIYVDITKVEKREAELLKQGRDASSPAVKRRVASQIKQLRDDMNRLNTTARMLGQQVDVISTHIHNLTLIQQGKVAKLPTTEEITEDAVRAEEMLEQLGADVELTSSLNTKVADSATSHEELAILEELEAPAEAGFETRAGETEESAPIAEVPETDTQKTEHREPETD